MCIFSWSNVIKDCACCVIPEQCHVNCPKLIRTHKPHRDGCIHFIPKLNYISLISSIRAARNGKEGRFRLPQPNHVHRQETTLVWIFRQSMTVRDCFMMAVSNSENQNFITYNCATSDSRFIHHPMPWCCHRNGPNRIMTNSRPSWTIQIT